MLGYLKHTIFTLILTQLAFALPEGFDYLHNIDNTIVIFPRYAQPINFVGEVIDGYRTSTIIITKQAGNALANVQKQKRQWITL
jgi:D-alanyl-D-alanine dipeptidase